MDQTPSPRAPSQTQFVMLGVSGVLWLLFWNGVASVGTAGMGRNFAVIGTGCLVTAMWIGVLVTMLSRSHEPRMAAALFMGLFLALDFAWAIAGIAAVQIGPNGSQAVAQNIVYTEVSVALAAAILLPALLRVGAVRLGGVLVVVTAAAAGLAIVGVAKAISVIPSVWTVVN